MRPAHGASSPFLAVGNARGWIQARGTPRTDATHGLAAIRTWHRLACVLAAMPWALNQLSDVAPAWVQQHVPPAWYPRYGLRSDQTRLPKDAGQREALARQVGADGDPLLAWVQIAETSLGLRALPALEARRRMWGQPYDRGPTPGRETLRGRTGDAPPPAAVCLASPDDLEARDRSPRETPGWAIRGTSPRPVIRARPSWVRSASRRRPPRRMASWARPSRTIEPPVLGCPAPGARQRVCRGRLPGDGPDPASGRGGWPRLRLL
jgi:hypothetical protein